MNDSRNQHSSSAAGARVATGSLSRLNDRMEDHQKNRASAISGDEKKFRVLVVDDNPVDQELAVLHMGQTWPYERELELDFAVDGAEALAKLQTKRFALVVLDWMLPVLGDGEVLRQLRHHGQRIPVVVISGCEREDIAADLNALQAAFLNKNQMNPDTFQLAIGHALTLLGMQWTAANASPCEQCQTESGLRPPAM